MRTFITILTIISTSLTMANCQSKQAVDSKIDVNGFEAKMKESKDFIVLDVRTLGEYKNGHLPNAIQIDYYSETFKAELNKLDKNKTVFMYCASGGRSGKSVPILTELGFKQVYDLEGGFQAWSRAAKAVVK